MHRIEYFSMLSIKNLTKTYEDAAVVDDVTIDLPPGKVISLIGPNGAGKSTVLGMISRLIARTHYYGLLLQSLHHDIFRFACSI